VLGDVVVGGRRWGGIGHGMICGCQFGGGCGCNVDVDVIAGVIAGVIVGVDGLGWHRRSLGRCCGLVAVGGRRWGGIGFGLIDVIQIGGGCGCNVDLGAIAGLGVLGWHRRSLWVCVRDGGWGRH